MGVDPALSSSLLSLSRPSYRLSPHLSSHRRPRLAPFDTLSAAPDSCLVPFLLEALAAHGHQPTHATSQQNAGQPGPRRISPRTPAHHPCLARSTGEDDCGARVDSPSSRKLDRPRPPVHGDHYRRCARRRVHVQVVHPLFAVNLDTLARKRGTHVPLPGTERHHPDLIYRRSSSPSSQLFIEHLADRHDFSVPSRLQAPRTEAPLQNVLRVLLTLRHRLPCPMVGR
jgi:hypothetical protein